MAKQPAPNTYSFLPRERKSIPPLLLHILNTSFGVTVDPDLLLRLDSQPGGYTPRAENGHYLGLRVLSNRPVTDHTCNKTAHFIASIAPVEPHYYCERWVDAFKVKWPSALLE